MVLSHHQGRDCGPELPGLLDAVGISDLEDGLRDLPAAIEAQQPGIRALPQALDSRNP